jgi:hypothetical protein
LLAPSRQSREPQPFLDAFYLSVVVVFVRTPDKHALGVAYSVRRREVECSVYVDEHAEAEASLDS